MSSSSILFINLHCLYLFSFWCTPLSFFPFSFLLALPISSPLLIVLLCGIWGALLVPPVGLKFWVEPCQHMHLD